jgi:hypothetical protein
MILLSQVFHDFVEFVDDVSFAFHRFDAGWKVTLLD